MLLADLRKMATDKGISGASSMRKSELISALGGSNPTAAPAQSSEAPAEQAPQAKDNREERPARQDQDNREERPARQDQDNREDSGQRRDNNNQNNQNRDRDGGTVTAVGVAATATGTATATVVVTTLSPRSPTTRSSFPWPASSTCWTITHSFAPPATCPDRPMPT